MSATMIGGGRQEGQSEIISGRISPSPALAGLTMVTAGKDKIGDRSRKRIRSVCFL
jgi:hypothetical protein